MITKHELEKKYSASSILELLEIVENKHNYTDSAVLVAIEELGRRNLTEEDISINKQQQLELVKEKIKKNYVDRLAIWQKHFFFFIWIPLLTFPFKRNLIDDGYEMKLKQAKYFSLLGFISMTTLTYLSIQFDLDNTTFWIILILEFALTLIFDGVFNPIYLFKESPDNEINESNSP